MVSLTDSISNYMLDNYTDIETPLRDAMFEEILENYQIFSNDKNWDIMLANYFYAELYSRAIKATFNANIYYEKLDEWLSNPIAHSQVGFSDKYLILDNDTVPVYRNTNNYFDEITESSFDSKYPVVNLFLNNPSIVVEVINDEAKIIKLVEEKEEISFSVSQYKNNKSSNKILTIPLQVAYLDEYNLIRDMLNNLSQFLIDSNNIDIYLIDPEDDENK